MQKDQIIRNFLQSIWNDKKTELIGQFIASEYTIHLDPGDPWEGQTLDHQTFLQRLQNSFVPFPDIHFKVVATLEEQAHVAVHWEMTGTNLGPIGQLPPTGKKIRTTGFTFYCFNNGLINGHHQIFDRSTVTKQLGFN